MSWPKFAVGLAILTATICTLADPSCAQRDLPPERGGLTYELGMPPVYKGRAGFEFGWFRPQTASEMSGLFNAGLSKDLGSPVVGIAALRLEGYLGFVNNRQFDGGGRALLEMPNFHLGLGTDFNASDEVFDFLLALDLPLRRGGLFGRGSTLALRWMPSRDQTFTVGVNVPLWGRNIGATRPMRDHVPLTKRDPARLEMDLGEQELARVLDELRDRAHWIARLSQPFAERSGADPRAAMTPVLDELVEHLAVTDARFPSGHSLPEEIRVYHEDLEHAFALAAEGDPALGSSIGALARESLLDEVLLAYNRLLGQRKTNDSLTGKNAIAQTRFVNRLLADYELSREKQRRVFYVFQTLCDIAEETRRELRDRWEDSRFVWLPLQLALKPEQHDSQAELDAIIAKAVEREFTPLNRVWYVINEEFQWELARSVRHAEDYHVLWIHDFRGRNDDGEPDAIAYAHTLNYLEALIERVEDFDRRGDLPQYFLILDQHYFEINKSRLWLRLLLDPLDYDLSLPGKHSDWELRIRETQERLREAVDSSVLLQVAASQYGRDWLKDQIKVHVNITNPADTSFFSWHVAGIIPIPDNMMRDHRKIAFYDVSEADPYRGMALFTGMGIGEHYVGPGWEDRALMIQGPGALAVKDAARGLLEAQGYEPHEIPYPLRRQDKPADYEAKLEDMRAQRVPAWLDDPGRVLQLHNETGFHDKPINVAKAVLYSLMPSGSVLEVPDSLWQSYIYASLLAGSALRGCRVVVIAPTKDSAPSAAPPTLARAHGLLGRLIVFSNELDATIAEQGGLLKVGLYRPRQGVGDLLGRLRQARDNQPAWIRRFSPANPAATEAIDRAVARLDSLGFHEQYLEGTTAEASPKIHLKANFLASKTAWERLTTSPELPAVVRDHIAYLQHQMTVRADGDSGTDVQEYPEQLREDWFRLIERLLKESTPREREEFIHYFTVGSVNMDYRSMCMDGEAMITLAGWQSLYGVLDFLLLPGLCDWMETTEDLDALLPPPGGITRSVAGLMKLSF